MQRSKQPIMILTCQHDSHYFDERNIVVNDVIKVGRAVARSKATPTNAIFDCKVLSRNHAIIWFKSDEFWLRDTNSSNGTFVNNARVVKRDDSESCDRQIFSGDVIRFGVDVVENDMTHGCIIASVTLFFPNGTEAKPKIGQTGDTVPAGFIPINAEQMFQLSCFLNDTMFREQALEKKLETLRSALQETQVASDLGWQAMLNEEKLLQKLDLYENQMRIFKENLPDNTLTAQIAAALEAKHLQETEFKNQLNRILKEKESALERVKELERILEDLEEECKYMRENYANAQSTCSTISTDYKTSLASINQRLNETINERNVLTEQLARSSDDNQVLQRQLDLLSHELVTLKEIHDEVQLKVKDGLPNGLPYNEESERKNGEVDILNDMDTDDNKCKSFENINDRESLNCVPGADMGDDLLKPQANEYLIDSIRDFHQSLELIRLLKAKISRDSATDIDCASPPDNGMHSSLSVKSFECLVKRILRHHETAMTSLHAYLVQVNPSAAAELINKIHLKAPEFGEINMFNEVEIAGSGLFAVSPTSTDSPKASRPDYLTLQPANKESSPSRSSVEGVTVVGADSSNTHSTSPTVSTNGCTNLSPSFSDPDEVFHLKDQTEADLLKESMRLANEEIAQYRAVIVDLEQSFATRQKKTEEETIVSTVHNFTENGEAESKTLLALRAECDELRAKMGEIEEQMQQTRENHCRLVEETRQHRTEVEQLRSERERLESALSESQSRIQQFQTSTSVVAALNNTHTATSVAFDDSQTESESFELLPRRLATMSSLAVIPLMVLVFAIMFTIFSKFVS